MTTINSSQCQLCYQSAIDLLDGEYLFGHKSLIRYLLVGYLSGGHILIEGPPGTAKTSAARLLAALMSKRFCRIQFTSDMLPSDLLGAHMYNPGNQSFDFVRGPVFSDFIIADEINRTPPRTQSALLEAMEEKQVTVEGETFALPPDFFVVATQNPQDYEGTYPLPESQLDRFLFRIELNHASAEDEVSILREILNGKLPPKVAELTPMAFERQDLEREINAVEVSDSLLRYIADLIGQTRRHQLLIGGSGVRGGIAFVRCARVLALMEGRNFVIPDDIKELAVLILAHRIKLSPDAQIAQINESDIIREIIEQTPFPE